MTIKILLVILFVILSAIFSGTEIVFAKVNKLKLEREKEEGNKKSAKALDVANDYTKTITTILIGNNLVNIAMASVSSVLALDLLKDRFSEDVISLLTTAVVTVVVLIFGEILPKTIAPNFSYSLSRILAPFVNFCSKLFLPLIKIVTKSTSKLTDKMDDTLDSEEELDTTDDELINMTEELEDNGQIDEDDAELIRSAIEITDTKAWEIMIPRVDVKAIDIEDFDKAIEETDFFENSRVPVYQDTIDHVIGIIDTVSVLKCLLSKQPVKLQDVLYQPLYVPKTMDVLDVLQELKKSHIHLAIVLDEWGGFMGILTIEDILEELFGEIWDETDVVENEYEKINDNTYLVDGDMNIHDFFDLVEYDDRDFETEYTTVGGWCTEILEKFPIENDEFEFENLKITILKMDVHRVDKIKAEIKINDQTEA